MTTTSLVVGGSGGIGRACADRFRALGGNVIVIDRALGHDACDPDSVRQVLRDAGPLQNVIHAAGSVGEGGIEDLTLQQWRESSTTT